MWYIWTSNKKELSKEMKNLVVESKFIHVVRMALNDTESKVLIKGKTTDKLKFRWRKELFVNPT